MKPTLWTPLVLLVVVCATVLASDTSDLMQKKTGHAEKILRYLALGDLPKVEFEATSLARITEEAGFEGHQEEYRKYGTEFLKIVRALETEARARNMAGSYYQFSRMTGMCFSCHEHLRDGDG